MSNQLMDRIKKKAFTSQAFLVGIVTLLFMLVASFLDKDFLTWGNLNNLVLNAFPLIIIAYAQTLIIISGELDLSLGGIVSFSNVVCVNLMEAFTGWGYIVAIVATLLLGLACGALNSVIIVKGRLSSVITTIATSSIFSGLALAIRSIPGGKVSREFSRFIMGKTWFHFPLIFLIIVTIILYYFITKTVISRHIRAVGGNNNAAYSAGISVQKIKFIVFCLAGLLSSIVAIYITAQMRAADATVGTSYTMNSITVAVVGGTALTGAVGNVFGSIIGAFLIMSMNNILNLIGVSAFFQYVFQGLILVIALAISSLRNRKRN